MNSQHIEGALAKIRVIFEKASGRIESIKPGEKIPATTLANEIAAEHGTTGPYLYPVLKYLLEGYPGVEIRRGAHGGIYKIPPKVEAKPVAPVVDTSKAEESDVT